MRMIVLWSHQSMLLAPQLGPGLFAPACALLCARCCSVSRGRKVVAGTTRWPAALHASASASLVCASVLCVPQSTWDSS